MLFIDLEHFKIIKDYNFHTYSIDAKIDLNIAVFELKKILDAVTRSLIKKDSIAAHYEINLGGDEEVAEDDDCDKFLSIVNIILTAFFKNMTTEERRESDYRLDVPEKLKSIKMSYSLLKKACNNKTINNIFNLSIKYKDLTFTLCDERYVEAEDTFVHSLDELEVYDA